MRKLLLLCIALLVGMPLRATIDGQGLLVNLTLADGLTGETVNRVMTDHSGLTWIATSSGINVFNGKYLQSYYVMGGKGHPLEVYDLCETRNHTIYAATEDGLYRLDASSSRFEKILPQVLRPISLFVDGNTVYIGGEQGMQIYDGKLFKQQDVGISRQGLDNIVRQYIKDEQGLIWFLGRHELNSYNPKTGKIIPCGLTSSELGKLAVSRFDKADGKFFIGTRASGLFVYDPVKQEVRHLPEVGHIITSVCKDHEGRICVATDGTGAYVIDAKSERVLSHYAMHADGDKQLPTNAVYCFNRDANGVSWFGFVRYGLAYTPHHAGLFQLYEPDGFSTLGLNVRCFYMRGSETLIGMQDGLWFIDSKRHIRRYFSAEDMDGHIVNNIKWWNGLYYIGMYDGGIRVFDPRTVNLGMPSQKELHVRYTIGDIKVAPDSALWIGCSDGLFIISQDGSIKNYNEQNSHIVGGLIINITFDRSGNAWLAAAKGLSLYSGASKEIVDTNFPADFFDKEGYMRGVLGHDGIVYMRSGPQLFYTTERMEKYGELKLPIRLTDKWCRGMVDDGKGRLLLASERGLLSINYEARDLLQIGAGEGLLGDQISDIQLDGQRMLWVATSAGIFSAPLKAVEQRETDRRYPIVLSQIRKGSDLIDMHEMYQAHDQHEIDLDWNLTSVVLQAEPILLDYALHRNRFYEYRIDDGEWMLISHGEPFAVRNLMIGHHKLEVRLAGAKGSTTEWTISVVPSVWAMLEFVLLLVFVVLLWLWYRYHRDTTALLSERNEIEDALIEMEHEVEELKDEEAIRKYQKVKIDEAECADIVKRVKEYIERERIYTNADLKMKDLADELNLSAPKLSQVFNIYLKENYYEFINRYRLNEFKRLIEVGEYKRYTITALSERCGFKKSNFFSSFRKMEGMTPAEYLKKQGIKI